MFISKKSKEKEKEEKNNAQKKKKKSPASLKQEQQNNIKKENFKKRTQEVQHDGEAPQATPSPKNDELQPLIMRIVINFGDAMQHDD